jgi:nicotinate-nucleotide pyrophosphorylase (carboxylating)
MINDTKFKEELNIIIDNAIREDIGEGDHSSLACIPPEAIGKAQLLVKDDGILAGSDFAKMVFHKIDPDLTIEQHIRDGQFVRYGDIAFTVKGRSQSILKAERIVLNAIQRMSAIATKTNRYAKILQDTNTKILDTRKTTPGIRALEKWAVKIGGGNNHRFGLYDMIMLKDNHIDFAGGIKEAILKTNRYIKEKGLNIKIEIETRNLDEVKQVLDIGQVDRIMLDNFSFDDLKTAVKWINGKYETEASGGITEKTLLKYALCGVDYISSGALTHSVSNMDFSLKAV